MYWKFMTVSQHYFSLFLTRDKAIDVKRVFLDTLWLWEKGGVQLWVYGVRRV